MARCLRGLGLMALSWVLLLGGCLAPSQQSEQLPSNGSVLPPSPVPRSAEDATPRPIHSPIAASPSAARTEAGLSIAQLSEDIADVVEQVAPAVVYISAERRVASGGFFFQRVPVTTSGSGVILDPQGYILTNNHVAGGAARIEVSLLGFGTSFQARIVGTDPTTDLAVIKIEGDGFPAAQFGDPSRLRPGNLVVAIGNPLGLDGGATITLGVVSNLERSVTVETTTLYDLVQTDAAINPGNSGGPLVNMEGRVVGINTVMVGGAENIGFAVGATTAKPVFEALIGSGHKVIRPWLGVVLMSVTPRVAAEQNLSIKTGVMAVRVEPDSPAGEVGLEAGDVITEFEGLEVTEATQLIKALWQHRVGERVTIKYWRGKEMREIRVDLTERPDGS